MPDNHSAPLQSRKQALPGYGVILIVTLFFILLPPFPRSRAENSDEKLINLAAELVKLRGEIESLSQELEMEKSQTRDQLQSLGTQKAELEVQIRKENLRLKQIKQALETHREQRVKERVSQEYLTPVVQAQIEKLKEYVKESLPFMVQERGAEIDRVEEKLAGYDLDPEKALAQIWALLEDEFRIAHENGLYRQVIVLGEEELIADVARLGMIMMFFKTKDGRVGKAAPGENGWEYRLIDSRGDRDRVLLLFDSLKKQIRQGYFEIPNAV